MRLAALTVCVGFAPILARGLARWKAGADALAVSTEPEDRETIALCESLDVPLLLTNDFHRDGDFFNKAAGMNRIIESGLIPWDEWGLVFDADIVPPENWREMIEAAKPETACLYGAPRDNEQGHYLQETSHAGYFQMFHTQAPPARRQPVFDDVTAYHGFARGYMGFDIEFMARWPERLRQLVPGLRVTHIGERGTGVRKWMLQRSIASYEAKLGKDGTVWAKQRSAHA